MLLAPRFPGSCSMLQLAYTVRPAEQLLLALHTHAVPSVLQDVALLPSMIAVTAVLCRGAAPSYCLQDCLQPATAYLVVLCVASWVCAWMCVHAVGCLELANLEVWQQSSTVRLQTTASTSACRCLQRMSTLEVCCLS
jgi:hypothetical protein